MENSRGCRIIRRKLISGISGQIEITSYRSGAELQGQLEKVIVDDSLNFPSKPIALRGRWVGHVGKQKFRFAKLMWFTGKLRPLCKGTIYESHGESVISARVHSAGIWPVPFILIYLALYATGHVAGNWMLPIGSVIYVYTALSGYVVGFKEIFALLVAVAEGRENLEV